LRSFFGQWKFSENRFDPDGDPDQVPGLIPERSRRWLEVIPTMFGIKSGSRRLSPLDFGIKKKFCILLFETDRRFETVRVRTPRFHFGLRATPLRQADNYFTVKNL